MDFEQIVNKAAKDSFIYFVGRPSLADQLEKKCQRKSIKLFKDHVNSQRGKSDSDLLKKYIKWSVISCGASVLICMLLAVYLRS